MRFSLILATVDRTSELKRFLCSLTQQTYQNFEVIIVDQNPDNRLLPIIESFKKKFSIIHIRSERGLSRARNVGLKYASGDVIAFPDDDCWYPPDILQCIDNFLSNHPEIDGLTGKSVDESGRPSADRWDLKAGFLDKINIWKRAISVTIFLRKTVVEKIGPFDENLGVGSGTKWGSAEEKDYLLRALYKGFRLFYNPDLIVYHHHPVKSYNERAITRALSYGMGMGYVLGKHKYPLWFVIYMVCRPLVGLILSMATLRKRKARYHWNVFKGRLSGYISSINEKLGR